MPIRFRCCYCDQLLGIARRKAGQVIECPSCHGKVGVPLTDGSPVPPPRPSPAQPVEREDFTLHQAKVGPILVSGLEPTPPPLPVPVPTAGIRLSPLHATMLTVAAVVLLALAFAIGLFLGRYAL